MSEEKSQTLLLGLGGTGSRIVNRVAAELKKKKININDGDVCCAVFDTNDNDRKKIKKTGVGIPVISTSKERIIADYVKVHQDKDPESWLPYSAAFYREGFGDGASQMRPKSRLAFLDTIHDKKVLQPLIDQINSMFTNRKTSKIRVMIVSSLAGGTGSGMFIQTALWVRDYFRKVKKCEVTIRGIFLLPDIFIDTIQDIAEDDEQIKSIYANAYAAIRELNTITKVKLKGFEPQVPFKIGDLFDSERDCECGDSVLNYAFFMDNITENGAVLSNIVHYEQVAARLVYMQLYAPLSEDMNSQEDNLFKRFIQTTEPSFGSCGTAKAVYPTEDVLRYCVLNSVKDAISSGWYKIDDEIKAKQKKEDDAEANGEFLKQRIIPRNEFMRLFENKTAREGDQIGREKLFLKIANDINNVEYDIGEDGKAVPRYISKIDSFIQLLMEQIAIRVDTDSPGDLSNFKLPDSFAKNANGNSISTDTKETLLKMVDAKEKAVVSLLNAVDNDAEIMAEEILEVVFPTDMADVNRGNLVSVLGLLTKSNTDNETYFVHPLAVRYLLYKLSEALETAKTGAVLPGLRQSAIEGHGKIGNEVRKKVDFDNPKTGKTEETPRDYLNSRACWQVFRNETAFINYFKKKYAEFNSAQYQLSRAYAIELIYSKLAVSLSKRLEAMIDLVETFFRSLPKVINTLQAEITKNAKKNELEEEKVIYVCASAKEKRALYDSLRFNAGDNDDKNINSMIVNALYGQFCAAENPDAEANKKYINADIVKSFYNEAMSSFKKHLLKKYSNEINLDIYSAICKADDFVYEEEQKNKKDDFAEELPEFIDIDEATGECADSDEVYVRHTQAVEAMLTRIFDASAPFLQCNEIISDVSQQNQFDEVDAKKNPDELTPKHACYWGFHPNLVNQYRELGKKFHINTNTQSSSDYSKNEIECYRASYGIRAGAVDKFNELGGGAYYTSYRNVIDDMIKGVAEGRDEVLVQTPHLDKTWHNILPYITPEMQKNDDMQFYRRFWLAVAYGMIYVANDGKFKIKRSKTSNTGVGYEDAESIVYNGKALGKVDVYELLAALRIDGAFMQDAAGVEKRFEKECEELVNYEDTMFLRGKTVKDVLKKKEDGEVIKTQFGGLAAKGDTNAVTLIIRYLNSTKHNKDVVANLVYYLDSLCYELVQNKYEKNEHEKIRAKSFEICKRIFTASAMKNKDSNFFAHWKDAWTTSPVEE